MTFIDHFTLTSKRHRTQAIKGRQGLPAQACLVCLELGHASFDRDGDERAGAVDLLREETHVGVSIPC